MRTEISPTGTGRLPRELLAAAVEDRQCTGFSASFLHTSEGGTTRCFGASCVKQFKHLCTDFGWSTAMGDGWVGLSDVTSERPLQLVANRSLAALQLGESLARYATV